MIMSRDEPKYPVTVETSRAGGIPEILALVDVMGMPTDRARSSAKDSPGMRTATQELRVTNPLSPFLARNTIVRGPGQNIAMIFAALSGTPSASSARSNDQRHCFVCRSFLEFIKPCQYGLIVISGSKPVKRFSGVRDNTAVDYAIRGAS